jgi:hypothetical protein
MCDNTTVKFRKRVFVEFKDDQGNIKKGVMKSNDGFTCKILVNSKVYVVSRKQIKFVKE